VRRVLTLLAGVFFLAAVMPGWAQNQAEASGEAIPAAHHSEMECSGFISSSPVPDDLYVDGGADNDNLDTYHAFGTGNYVFLHIHRGTGPVVGQEYRLVRPVSDSFGKALTRSGMGDMPTYGYTDWYPMQNWDIHKLGQPYADTGRVKVVKLTEEGVIAQVEFACVPVNIGDLAIPYEVRPIPTFTETANPDRFALSNGKKIGSILAVKDNFESAGLGGIVYLDLGQSENVQPGEKFRVVHVLRLPSQGLLVPPTLPDETVGEVVVLWTEDKTSVGIVVRALRDIDAGDAVQME
jgi:hypothetical protein